MHKVGAIYFWTFGLDNLELSQQLKKIEILSADFFTTQSQILFGILYYNNNQTPTDSEILTLNDKTNRQRSQEQLMKRYECIRWSLTKLKSDIPSWLDLIIPNLKITKRLEFTFKTGL